MPHPQLDTAISHPQLGSISQPQLGATSQQEALRAAHRSRRRARKPFRPPHGSQQGSTTSQPQLGAISQPQLGAISQPQLGAVSQQPPRLNSPALADGAKQKLAASASEAINRDISVSPGFKHGLVGEQAPTQIPFRAASRRAQFRLSVDSYGQRVRRPAQ